MTPLLPPPTLSYVPVVVAKCGLYLKDTATEVPGTFRVSGSAKRMKELQAVFDNGPKVGLREGGPVVFGWGVGAADALGARTVWEELGLEKDVVHHS